MDNDTQDSFFIRGDALKRRVTSSVSDGDAFRVAANNPDRYRLAGALRPNMLKARDDALERRMHHCSGADPWVREIIVKWCNLSGLPSNEADFWRDRGFMEAIRNGRDLQVRRYVDDDGWGWIVVRDSPSHWVHRKRLPETTRARMVAAKAKRQAQEKKWW